MDSLFVVFNPRSGKGRGASLVEPLLAHLRALGPVEHALTTRPGEERGLARDAATRFDRVVAVGGDGTWSNVANGILDAGRADAVKLGLVPGGTGCDLAKSLAIPARDLAACARIARGDHERRIDAGRVEGRHFLNIAGGVLNFRETFIDNGDVDMLKAMRVYKEVGYDGMMMPDHVPQVEGVDSQQGFAYAFGYIKALIAAVSAEG